MSAGHQPPRDHINTPNLASIFSDLVSGMMDTDTVEGMDACGNRNATSRIQQQSFALSSSSFQSSVTCRNPGEDLFVLPFSFYAVVSHVWKPAAKTVDADESSYAHANKSPQTIVTSSWTLISAMGLSQEGWLAQNLDISTRSAVSPPLTYTFSSPEFEGTRVTPWSLVCFLPLCVEPLLYKKIEGFVPLALLIISDCLDHSMLLPCIFLRM